MNFHVIGVNHNSAPLEVRERLAVPEAQLPDAVRSLVQQPGVDEGMVLSTCNRVEVVTSTKQGADLRGFLGSYFGVSPTALNSHIYEFEQREAVRHVFRVASSLDSMVVGEPQILGQVKEAYALARGMGAIHSGLEALLSRAFAVAKRVRKGRRSRPMFFIDIAVPRNVHPDMNKVDGMFVYDVDDLQSVATDNAGERKKEAERAEKIIELEVDRFASRMKSLAVVPTILSLQEYCETIRQAEIDRIRGKLGTITPEQEAAIDAMTRGIINKLLHTPITTLKSSTDHPEAATIHEMIRRLFNLNTGKPKE